MRKSTTFVTLIGTTSTLSATLNTSLRFTEAARVALLSFNSVYSTKNFSAAKGNSIFYYTKLSSEPRAVTIPDGTYGISELGKAISVLMIAAEETTAGVTPAQSAIRLSGDDVIGRVRLDLDSGYAVNWGQMPAIAAILGYAPVTTSGATSPSFMGDYVPQLEPFHAISLSTNLTTNSISTRKGEITRGVMAIFPVKVFVGAEIVYTPYQLSWFQLSTMLLSTASVSISTETGAPLDFGGERITIVLQIEDDA